jgi:hypothetical protein
MFVKWYKPYPVNPRTAPFKAVSLAEGARVTNMVATGYSKEIEEAAK